MEVPLECRIAYGSENVIVKICTKTTSSPSSATAFSVDTPSSATAFPVDTPSAAIDTPSAAIDTPSAAIDTPSAAIDTPSAAIDTPSAAIDTPSAAIDTPSAASPSSAKKNRKSLRGTTTPSPRETPSDSPSPSYFQGPSSALSTALVSPVPSSEVWTSPPNVAIGSTFEPLYLLIMVPFVGLFAIWAWRRCGGKRKTGTVCPGGGQPEKKQSVEEDPKTVTTDNPVVQALQQGEDKTTEPVGEINPTPVGNPPVRQQIDRTARLVQMLHSRRRRLPPLPPARER